MQTCKGAYSSTLRWNQYFKAQSIYTSVQSEDNKVEVGIERENDIKDDNGYVAF